MQDVSAQSIVWQYASVYKHASRENRGPRWSFGLRAADPDGAKASGGLVSVGPDRTHANVTEKR